MWRHLLQPLGLDSRDASQIALGCKDELVVQYARMAFSHGSAAGMHRSTMVSHKCSVHAVGLQECHVPGKARQKALQHTFPMLFRAVCADAVFNRAFVSTFLCLQAMLCAQLTQLLGNINGLSHGAQMHSISLAPLAFTFISALERTKDIEPRQMVSRVTQELDTRVTGTTTTSIDSSGTSLLILVVKIFIRLDAKEYALG